MQIELWPTPSIEQLHSLLIIRNDRPDTAELWPPVQMKFQQSKSVFLMMVQQETGFLVFLISKNCLNYFEII